MGVRRATRDTICFADCRAALGGLAAKGRQAPGDYISIRGSPRVPRRQGPRKQPRQPGRAGECHWVSFYIIDLSASSSEHSMLHCILHATLGDTNFITHIH